MKEKIKIIVIALVLVIIIVIAVIVTNKKSDELITNDTNLETVTISENAVLDVNKDSFENEVIKSEKKVLIDFYADWCGPCNRLSPIVDKVAEENKNIKVVRIDVDTNEELMKKYNIISIPTLVVIENGEEVARHVGLTTEEEILKLVGIN